MSEHMSEPGTPNITQIEGSSAGKRIGLMLVGAVVVLIAIAVYFYIGRTKPIASGEVSQVFLYPVHHEGTVPTTVGTVVTTKPDIEDTILVLTQVKLTNVGTHPLTLVELEGAFTAPDGEQRSDTVGQEDYRRVFLAYPKLADQKRAGMFTGMKIAPGETVEGEAIFHYPGTRDAWDKRKTFNVVATFDRNPPLTIVVPPTP
jgi:hypothetical protein